MEVEINIIYSSVYLSKLCTDSYEILLRR